MKQFVRDNPFIRNSAVLFFGTMIMNVLNYVFHLVVGRLVTPSVYGEIESLISLLAIVSVPAAVITLIATKHAAQMKRENNLAGSAAVFAYLSTRVALFGLPFLVVAFVLTPSIGRFLRIESSQPLYFLWILIVLSFLSAVGTGILSGWQRFSHINVAAVSGALVKLILGALLIRAGFAVNGAIGSFVAAGLIGYLVTLQYLRPLIATSSVSSANATEAIAPVILDTRDIRQSVMPTLIGILAVTLLGNADMIFAKHALSPEVSGTYGALSVVAKTIFFLTGVVASVVFAMTSGEDQRSETSRKTLKQAIILVILFSGCAVIFFALFPRFSLGVFFGATYIEASGFLFAFALTAALYSIANLLIQYILPLHRMRMMLGFLAIALVEIFALSLYGKSLYTVIVIAGLAQVLAIALGWWHIRRLVRFGT